jgi:hypothetical protein
MFHDEPRRVATLATAKTLEQVFGWGHRKGRRLLIVERAQPDHVHPSAFEAYIVINDFFNFGRLQYFLNRFLWNQSLMITGG